MDGEIELEFSLLLHSQSEHNQKEGQIEVNRARLGERSVDEKGGVSTEQEKRRVNQDYGAYEVLGGLGEDEEGLEGNAVARQSDHQQQEY